MPASFKFNVKLAVPKGYDPDPNIVSIARDAGASIIITRDPLEAADGADVVMTDTWVSMGQVGSDKILADMKPYQVNDKAMASAKDDAVFMHCLPAHAGEEASQQVLDSVQSIIFDQAENRLHAQKAILRWCFGLIG